MAGGFGVAADPGADGEEAFLRHGSGRQVDHAAAEFTGEVGGIAFLDQRRGNDVGRENVQRHHAAQRFGAGQRRAVEQRQRIAITQAAHIDEPAADHAEAGNAAERTCDVAFAGTGDFGGGQHRDDLIGRTGDIAVAGHHDFAGQRDVDLFLCRRFLGRGGIRGRRGLVDRRSGPVLRLGQRGRGQGGRKQQQGCKPRRVHREFPPRSVGLEIGCAKGGSRVSAAPRHGCRRPISWSAAKCTGRCCRCRTRRRCCCRSSPDTRCRRRP